MSRQVHKIEVGGKTYELTVNTDSTYGYHSTVAGVNFGIFGITTYPTQNCQLSSIAPFSSLLNANYVSMEHKRELLAEVWKLCGGLNQVLVDVKERNYQETIEFFGRENMVIHTSYTSTNGSNMDIFIFNMIMFVKKYSKQKTDE